MRKATLMVSMALLALAAFVPVAGAQEAADTEAMIEEIQAENDFFGGGFFADFLGNGFFAGLFGGFDADDDGGLTPEEAAAGDMEEPASDNQYDPEADDTFGLTSEQLAEGNMEEPVSNNQYDPTADSTGGLTAEEAAAGDVEEPASDNQYDPTR